MQVHLLNAGTMCPRGGRLVSGSGGLFERAKLVCNVLLVETGDGLALIDTGLGAGDLAEPRRLGHDFLRNNAPRLDPAETAVAQVKALGFSPTDVRHILLTHLDRDHAGGIADFPSAHIHVHVREHEVAVKGAPAVRYVRGQWQHGPRWSFYGDAGEPWFGFQGVRALGDQEPDILMIPLPGHTVGHCGIAVRSGGGWLLHAGDGYFHHREIETPRRRAPMALSLFQRKFDVDRKLRIANRERLRTLNAMHGDQVTVICSHDPNEDARCLGFTQRR